MLQCDSCTFIFFIELLLISWLVEMLKLQKCSVRDIIIRVAGVGDRHFLSLSELPGKRLLDGLPEN